MLRFRSFPILSLGQNKGGLIVEENERRSRPSDPLAKRTIGYKNLASEHGVGIEEQYNGYLSGKNGLRLEQRMARGVWKPVFNNQTVEPQNGKDILTTIDTRIQDVAHSALRTCVEDNMAHHGCAVLMEVATGKILAISNLTRQRDGSYGEEINYAISEAVEPGSTFKLASSLAILEEGLYDTSTIVPTGIESYYGSKMVDSHREGYGNISFQSAFEKSSNVGISHLAVASFRGKQQKFIDYLYKMRLNKKTGIDIPGEAQPYIKDTAEKTWSNLSLPWISIGYEIRLSPLQILNFYNAVANNGKMMQPYLVEKIMLGESVVESFEPKVLVDRIAKERNLNFVRGMLENVVERGTAKSLASSPYKVAGKTGTAQINYANRDGKMRYRASFVGYFPADKPLYSCIVMITDPQKNKVYGSDLAAPVFKEIADKVYATLLKERPEGGGELHLESPESKFPRQMAGYGKDINVVCEALNLGLNRVEEASYEYRSRKQDEKGYQVRDIDRQRDLMPNLKGLGARDAIYILEKQGLHPQIYGSGRVKSQSISPGSRVGRNTIVVLELS